MRKRMFLSLALVAVLAMLLTGCRQLRHKEILEEQLDKVITAMNRDDPNALYDLFYEMPTGRTEFDRDYASMAEAWEGSGEYTTRTASYHASSTSQGSTYTATYEITFSQWVCVMTLVYIEDASGNGLQAVQFTPGALEEVVGPQSGSLTRIKTPFQWFLLAVSLVQLGLLVYTVVDIFRRKPRQYGLWLLIAFLAVRPYFTIQSGIQIGFTVGLSVNFWQHLIYDGGVQQFIAVIPLGMIIYWCKRRSLKPRPKPQAPQNQEGTGPVEP